jgi:predicted TIM-barrel fold metal-dependent hydrolase
MCAGVGLDVFEAFRPVMRELGMVMQCGAIGALLPDVAATLREISREMPVVIDHMLNIPASAASTIRASGAASPGRRGHAYKTVGALPAVRQFPDYPDARAFHDALVRANPERLLWGTDWPHPSIDAAVMPDDGHLVDLFQQWTPDEKTRQLILVETPARLFACGRLAWRIRLTLMHRMMVDTR